MFIGLNTILNINNQTPPKGKFFLISEAHSDGSFLIHHFLSFYLKGGHKVCFLALVQSFSHYSSISQKLGVSLSSSIQNGKLVFIEGLKCALKGMDIPEEKVDENPFVGLGKPNFSLKPLFEKVKEEILKIADGDPYLLLIDDISVLLSLHVSAIQVQDFVQYCQVNVCTPEKGGCLVILEHAECDLEDSDEEILEKHLIYKSNLELHVKGLSSGYCREVHGQLDIIDHDIAKTTGYPSQKTAQYKIMDKTVTFFAPGTSSSVL